MNDLCILFIYHDVAVSENKLLVNVDMRTPLSPAPIVSMTSTRLKHPHSKSECGWLQDVLFIYLFTEIFRKRSPHAINRNKQKKMGKGKFCEPVDKG